jgi:MOSC domain-containing protein YiiM
MRRILFGVLIHLYSWRVAWSNKNPRKSSSSRTAFVLASSLFGPRQKCKHHQCQQLGVLFFGSPSNQGENTDSDTSSIDIDNAVTGRVIRLAARSYHPLHSKPSSREYTTRKIQQSSLQIYKEGVSNDYNHYRTMALQNTRNRAVSILTTDCLEYIRAHQYSVGDGDLGENILVHGLHYRFFQVDERYSFGQSCNNSQNRDDVVAVVLEITEPMIPCANLCKLPCINNEQKTPKERIEACQQFLDLLDKESGLRGWYAKVIQEGRIEPGAMVQRVVKTTAR